LVLLYVDLFCESNLGEIYHPPVKWRARYVETEREDVAGMYGLRDNVPVIMRAPTTESKEQAKRLASNDRRRVK